MAFFNTLNTRFRQHAAYRRTRHELESLPFDVKVDLDLNGRERDVAKAAIYG
ncbi:hypothetical protein SAMN05421853_10968 [Roseivivax halotolerans]|uniref:Uncharacterized protein n=1 Tax=Roseivivax halotolerans TaxID=93684 RepID=A0A1I5ZE28_9RHOB|nr:MULTISPECIES: hypothetical protein [Roseivivax]QFT63224.1 hypothetical protein FIU91_09835 [Roseivivax sp. THAF30]SFQ54658.1 hypothetical protein SAMN05421853_10968 [Roseivivax halotolerans]